MTVRVPNLSDQRHFKCGCEVKEHQLCHMTADKSPAGKAGIVAGDVITTINGKPVKDGRELQRLVADLPLGKPVDVKLLRDTKEMAVQVTIEEQPASFGSAVVPGRPAPHEEKEAVSLNKVGVECVALTMSGGKMSEGKEQLRRVAREVMPAFSRTRSPAQQLAPMAK